MVLLEVCAESLDGLRAAEGTSAGRIEFCSRIDLGGLSPARELLAAALLSTRLPVHVLVRPRPGDFVYTPSEIDLMQAEIAGLRATRVAGVVIGVLTQDLRIDLAAMSRLAAAARPMSVTFHRAFDEIPDHALALDELVDLGIDRILTSGSAHGAFAGRARIRDLVEHARGRIVVMAGGGVRAHNVAQILADTGVSEVHSSVPFDLPEPTAAPGNPPERGKLRGRSR
jgi:copper homeostasis protein